MSKSKSPQADAAFLQPFLSSIRGNINNQYLFHQQPNDNEFSSNAPLNSLSDASRLTNDHVFHPEEPTKPPLFSGDENVEQRSIGQLETIDETLASRRPTMHAGRSRHLRVNVIHQRLYHADEPSPSLHSSYDQVNTANGDLLPHISKVEIPQHVRKPLLSFKFAIPASILELILPDSPYFWLCLYFASNLSLTLYNKSVLIHFPYPYTLTALHALSGTVGTFVLLRLNPRYSEIGKGTQRLHSSWPVLNGKEWVTLSLFSVLYTFNIVVSNASLKLVNVAVVRASTPFFTMVLAAIILGKTCSSRKALSLIPIVMGVVFATYGDYYFTTAGFLLTFLGTVLAALKTILTNIILVESKADKIPVSLDLSANGTQTLNSSAPSLSFLVTIVNRILPPSPPQSLYATKLKSFSEPVSSFSVPKLSLSPLHLLYLLSPLAFLQSLILAHFSGELDLVLWCLFRSTSTSSDTVALNAYPQRQYIWLLLNGLLAFSLNVVSFNANKRVGPLGMSVASNVKQVLTILCAVFIFDLTITPANGVGIVLTLIGGALYAAVEYRERQG